MADAVTVYADLIKPEIGASGATWGLKWNQNADKIATKLADRPGKLEIGQMAELGTFNGTELVVMFQTTGEDEDRIVSATGAMKWSTLLEKVAEVSSDRIGDWKESWRDLTDEGYLRCDGSLKLRTDYPTLAAMAPLLPDDILWGAGDTLNLISVIHDGTKYVGIRNAAGTTYVYTSTDTETWTQVATISGFDGIRLAFGNALYLIVDGNGYYSRASSVSAWSAPARIAGSAGDFAFNWCSFGSGLFLAVGSGGAAYTSIDLVSWTLRSIGAGTSFLFWCGRVNSVHMILGASGFMATSPDGITWTPRSTGVAQPLQGAVWTGTLYVVIGGSGTIITSTNLTSWAPRTSGTTASLLYIANSSAGLVIGGDGTVALISANATAWTLISKAKSISGYHNITIDVLYPDRYLFNGPYLPGVRTSPDKFQLPNEPDGVTWIRAEYPEAA